MPALARSPALGGRSIVHFSYLGISLAHDCCLPQDTSSGGMPPKINSGSSSDADEQHGLPQWISLLLEKQTASLSSVISQQLSKIVEPGEPIGDPPSKKHKSSEESPIPLSDTIDHPQSSDNLDDFDERYGHLIGAHINDTDSPPPTEKESLGSEPADSEDSTDEDLVDVSDKVPNWDTSSSIKKFITNSIDRPLPDEVLKQLNEDYMPKEVLQEFFLPPKMPKRLYKLISGIKSKGAVRTERALFTTQRELFIVAKPLLAALIELRPLGSSVSKARELMSVSLRGIYSVSLGISRARRENVRFLFKDSLADALYAYDPNYSSLFGGKDFPSQLEKAAKEAKIDLSWSKNSQKKSQPFRSYGYQGFRYNKGAAKYFSRPSYKGRQKTSGYKGNRYQKSGAGKNKSGSSRSQE